MVRPRSYTDTMLVTIDTARLRLRALADADIPSLFAIFSNAEAMRYWSRGAMSDLAEAAELLAEIERGAEEGALLQWGLARREDDVVIGTCTLYGFERAHRRAELGYILRRDHWGRGYAGEALTALLDYAFDVLGLHRIEADIDPRNAASIRSVEKLGFKFEGRLRERYHVGAEIQDSAIYGLLARQWSSR